MAHEDSGTLVKPRYIPLWPDVSDLPSAEKAIRCGFGAATLVASVTAVVALLALFLHKPILGIDGGGLVDAAAFAGIAFGICRRSRAAALAGFAMYLGEMTYIVAQGSDISRGAVMRVLLVLYFLHGVRGTFAYRKLSNQQVPQSPTSFASELGSK
jgi:hypothetical protein